MNQLHILYITKLRHYNSNGVTVAVTQLLSTISRYCRVSWYDLDHYPSDSFTNVKILDKDDYLRCEPDIAVFIDPFNAIRFCWIARKLRKRKIPYLIVPHGCFHVQALKIKRLKKAVALKTMYRSFINRCLAVQYLSEGESRESVFGETRLVIPNGIDINKQFSVREHIKTVIFVGRKSVYTKGLDFLLDACTELKDRLRDRGIKVYLYGPAFDGEGEVIDNSITENGIGDIVFNMDSVFDDAKDRVYRDADLFIQTSRHEGFPMSLLEALSYGLPIAITKSTNFSEIVNKYKVGWVCEPSTDDVRTMLDAVCDAPSSVIQDYSKNAKVAASEYSWDKVCADTVTQYCALLNNRISGEKNV